MIYKYYMYTYLTFAHTVGLRKHTNIFCQLKQFLNALLHPKVPVSHLT